VPFHRIFYKYPASSRSKSRFSSAVAQKKAWAKAGKTGVSPPAKVEAYPIIAKQKGAEPPIAWEEAKVGPPRPNPFQVEIPKLFTQQ